ncbi:PIR protein [Plasmodium yoelii]|uniref:PIR protein n=2 Tax=Plasmodium yoelii TaxID=5861 RepID=A0AAE9WJN3_PLAYO|nr:PIR protein [Plasmodium yoelii]WBY55177.1 PIR protein [Plasmodium yoelii yoelii]CDU18687.1 YIR protein [Plasmodium yoelii]VTZ73085.1 PIR protein [Plasmodium yoelii]|eukprot:XP_022810868.1 PIR protein [Plasmodium yoelii]
MNTQMCKEFQEVRNSISDESEYKGITEFGDDHFLNKYCDSNQCHSDYDRISAGCLYLLDQLYKDSGVIPSPKNSNPYIVDYILIWLSYMLNLINSKEDNITDFYGSHINSCDKYKTEISELKNHYHDYGNYNYKGLIDKRKDFLYMDSNIVPKFYEAFKLLCNLYNELDYNNKNCEKYLKDNSEFFKKYKELKDSDITNSSPYKEMLSTLLTDYNDFKKECNSILSYLSAKEKEKPGQILLDSSGEYVDSLEQGIDNYDVASSSSSIVSKLIPILLIFGAIPIFLGISYKYSLFGFRKRVQKHLRKKLKK